MKLGELSQKLDNLFASYGIQLEIKNSNDADRNDGLFIELVEQELEVTSTQK